MDSALKELIEVFKTAIEKQDVYINLLKNSLEKSFDGDSSHVARLVDALENAVSKRHGQEEDLAKALDRYAQEIQAQRLPPVPAGFKMRFTIHFLHYTLFKKKIAILKIFILLNYILFYFILFYFILIFILNFELLTSVCRCR